MGRGKEQVAWRKRKRTLAPHNVVHIRFLSLCGVVYGPLALSLLAREKFDLVVHVDASYTTTVVCAIELQPYSALCARCVLHLVGYC